MPPLTSALIGPGSLLQSSLPGTVGPVRAVLRTPRLDAVVRTPVAGSSGVPGEAGPSGEPAAMALHPYSRDQHRPDENWRRGLIASSETLQPACLAQRPGTRWWPGNLEALSIEPDGVVHHWRDPNPRLDRPWERAGVLAPPAGAVALAAHLGGLDALVASDGGVRHLRWGNRLGRPDARGWRDAGALPVAEASGVDVVATPGRLDAVVTTADGVVWLTHARGSWRRRAVVAGPGDGPASVAASRGELFVAVPRGSGFDVHRAGRGAPRFERIERVECGLQGVAAVSLTASRLDGWLQALVQEGTSLFQWHRQRYDGGVRWMRAACLRFDDREPARAASRPSVKVAQITGDIDTQPSVRGRVTLSSSASRSGVLGTDLGVRVERGGASYLLCGDTHWRSPLLATRDSIAAISPDGPVPGAPGFEFHGAPLRLEGGGATMREYDVPLDAFEFGGRWFLFATSNHFMHHQVMGRSVLARAVGEPRLSGRSRRPLRFETLTTVSSHRLVNISCGWVPAAGLGLSEASEEPSDKQILALWGCGAYRADDLFLAVLDPDAAPLLGRPCFSPGRLGLRFYAGLRGGRPVWTPRESDARPLLPGALGELSVRWVPKIGRYVLLAMSGPEDPVGPAVTLRTSETPWGPWSPRIALFDWIARGMSFDDPSSRFIRATLEASEPVGDRIFRGQRDATGGAYAPYLFDTRLDAPDLVLRYTLSTWNPYQIVLMEQRLDAEALAAGSSPAG